MQTRGLKSWLTYGLILVGAVGVAMLLLILFVMPTNSRDNQNPARQAEMAQSVLAWGRLAPFPQNAQNFSIRTEGSTFTKSFRASFDASEQEIKKWMADSPGFQDATLEPTAEGARYIIRPGGGANQAEAVIDLKSGHVQVYVSWS